MKIRTKVLEIYLLFIFGITVLMAYYLLHYNPWSFSLFLFWISFYFFGSIILFDYVRRGTFFSFGILFNIFGALYTNYYIFSLIISGAVISEYTYKAMRLSYLSIFSFNIAYYFISISLKQSGSNIGLASSRKIHLYRYDINRIQLFLTALFLISIATEWYVIFLKIGISNYFYSTRAGKSLLMADYSLLTFYQHTIPIVAAVSLLVSLESNTNYSKILFFFSLCFSIFNAYIRGSRAELICILLPILFLLNFYNRISNRTVLFFGIVSFFLFGIWKSFYDTHRAISYDSEFNTWYRICNNVFSSGFAYRYGGSYLQTLKNLLIPVTNVTSLSKWYLQNYEASVLKRGGGRGFSGVLEAYMNFGILGNIIVYFFYGRLLKHIEVRKTPESSPRIGYKLVVALIIMSSMYLFFRAESYSLWKNLVWFKIYPTALIFYIARKSFSINQG